MSYRWLQTWRIGIKSLLLHPLRSLLTVLGIFIGTASVIWLLAVGPTIGALILDLFIRILLKLLYWKILLLTATFFREDYRFFQTHSLTKTN